MKMFVVLAALVATAFAAPQLHHQQQQQQFQQAQQFQPAQQFESPNPFHQNNEQQVVIVKEQPLDNIGVGGYSYGYELSNGESRQESAQVVNEGLENQSLVVRGSYSYVDPVTGQQYTVNYIADENGYRAEGAHIPA